MKLILFLASPVNAFIPLPILRARLYESVLVARGGAH